MTISAVQASAAREAARRIALAWQLDPCKVEAELLRVAEPRAVREKLERFCDIERALRAVNRLNPSFTGQSFWHDSRIGSTPPCELLGNPECDDLIDRLVEELDLAEDLFGALHATGRPLDLALVEHLREVLGPPEKEQLSRPGKLGCPDS